MHWKAIWNWLSNICIAVWPCAETILWHRRCSNHASKIWWRTICCRLTWTMLSIQRPRTCSPIGPRRRRSHAWRLRSKMTGQTRIIRIARRWWTTASTWAWTIERKDSSSCKRPGNHNELHKSFYSVFFIPIKHFNESRFNVTYCAEAYIRRHTWCSHAREACGNWMAFGLIAISCSFFRRPGLCDIAHAPHLMLFIFILLIYCDFWRAFCRSWPYAMSLMRTACYL